MLAATARWRRRWTRCPAASPPRDRAAAHRIAAAVLRRAASLDAVLEPFLRREPPAEVRAALRMGAAELLLLGTPPHAAVAAPSRWCRSPSPAWSTPCCAGSRRAAPAALEELDGPRLDTPPWLWTAWHAAYGPAARGHRRGASAARRRST